MQVVLPSQRYNSHLVPEDGSLTCEQPGICECASTPGTRCAFIAVCRNTEHVSAPWDPSVQEMFCVLQMFWGLTTPTASSKLKDWALLLRSCFPITCSPHRPMEGPKTLRKLKTAANHSQGDAMCHMLSDLMFSRPSWARLTWLGELIFTCWPKAWRHFVYFCLAFCLFVLGSASWF